MEKDISPATKLIAIGDALRNIKSDSRFRDMSSEKQTEFDALSEKVNDSLLVAAIDDDHAFAQFMYKQQKKSPYFYGS